MEKTIVLTCHLESGALMRLIIYLGICFEETTWTWWADVGGVRGTTISA
jgi:hypothetical protein